MEWWGSVYILLLFLKPIMHHSFGGREVYFVFDTLMLFPGNSRGDGGLLHEKDSSRGSDEWISALGVFSFGCITKLLNCWMSSFCLLQYDVNPIMNLSPLSNRDENVEWHIK